MKLSVTRELEDIAYTLSRDPFHPVATQQFKTLVQNMTRSERRDLLEVLRDMVADAENRPRRAR